MDKNWVYLQLVRHGVVPETASLLATLAVVLMVALITFVVTLRLRRIVLHLATQWVTKNKYKLDDLLLKNKVITLLTWFIPVVVANFLLDVLIPVENSTYIFFKRSLKVVFIALTVLSASALLTTGRDIFRLLRPRRADMIQGFVDAGRIIVFIIGIIFVISILSGVTPWGILSVLGGLTAVTLLIFKDTILGFVASVQLTMTDMVRVGDWVEMPSYGADGDVISMSIHTIRVQNWDKTITTIPTYALVANSFKNWRGMSESGGRRIKRALMIDVGSIRFCDEEMLARFAHIHLLDDYLAEKERDITEHNRHLQLAEDDLVCNGRHQTNIGVFRAYVTAYLQANPQINREMTFLVRQLPPSEHGLPLEIYVFSSEKRWAQYEAIQADIFDHLLAVMPLFSLRLFQAPTGFDLSALAGGKKDDCF